MKYGFDPKAHLEFQADLASPQDRLLLLRLQAPLLIKAASFGNIEIFKLLLEHGCDINTQGYICDDGRYTYESNVLGAAVTQIEIDYIRTIFGQSLQPKV